MTAVACRSGVELLMEYMEGALPPDVRAEVEFIPVDHVDQVLNAALHENPIEGEERFEHAAAG